MAKLKLVGVPSLDGEYDLDISTFTNGELRTIKQLSGVRAGELKEALLAGDNDVFVAFTVIVLQRAGKTVDPQQLWEADAGQITIVPDTAEVEPRPPDSPPPNGTENNGGGNGVQNGSTHRSGLASVSAGDDRQSDPSRIGLPGSETSATSGQKTSAA